MYGQCSVSVRLVFGYPGLGKVRKMAGIWIYYCVFPLTKAGAIKKRCPEQGAVLLIVVLN
jgi:hypothetical protein